MKLKDFVEEFLNYLSAVRGLSENTVTGYKNDLSLLQHFLSPEIEISSVTKENLLLCIGQLSRQKKAAASINRFISAVRTLFSFRLRYQYIQKNPALELKTVKNNINSTEYIENMAREKLGMYLPNERVYIDITN